MADAASQFLLYTKDHVSSLWAEGAALEKDNQPAPLPLYSERTTSPQMNVPLKEWARRERTNECEPPQNRRCL